jgi:hypothetical protein
MLITSYRLVFTFSGEYVESITLPSPFHFEVENNSLQTPDPRRYFDSRDISGVTQVNNGAVINDVGEQAAQTERWLTRCCSRFRPVKPSRHRP